MVVGLGLKKYHQLMNNLFASIQFRLFEIGTHLQCNICSYFGYEMSPKIHSIMSWNDSPVAQTLAYAAGIYIQSFGKCLNPNAKGVFRYPELVSELLKDKQRIPSYNYLSWALNGALSDKGLFPFVKELEISNLMCE